MAITFAKLGSLYSGYANTNLPWNNLHAYSAKLATMPAAKLRVVSSTPEMTMQAPEPQSYARRYACSAAVLPHHIMRVPDAIFGTGVHNGGKTVSIQNGNDAVKHLSECIRAPFDLGLAGIAQGLLMLQALVPGALLGAMVGAFLGGKGKTVDACASTGAVIFAAVFWVVPAIQLQLATGLMRSVTSLAKFAVVGAAYGLGYGVGTCVDWYKTSQGSVPAPAKA